VKEGSTLLRSNLEDISIDKASQICIMARDDMEEGEDENISNGDLLNLKIVLRLGSFDINPNCQIVVETDSDETRGQIENLSYTVASLKKLTVIPVSFNRKIGQIIAQSIVMPEISDIYEELFSFEGSEFYSGDYEGSIEDFMKTHDQAIPVYKGKAMFVLAEDEKACFRKREGKGPSPKPIKFREGKAADLSAVFIIGDNSKSEFVLENLQRSLDQGDAKFALHHYHKNENEALIADIKATEGPKKVLILSDDSVGASTYDANVFVTLIALSNAFPKRENITYITELLDSRNLSSVRDFSIKNTIISNRMMSLLITQLAMNRDAKVFFDRVLSNADGSGRANDFDIAVTPAGELLEMEEELHFESKGEAVLSFYHFSEGKIILLGTIEGEDPCFYDKNQDEKKEVVLSKDTLLVYFKYFD